MNKRMFLATVLACAIAAPTFAIDRYVPGDYQTIQTAIDASDSGDLIIVAPGTYAEAIDFGIKTSSSAALTVPRRRRLMRPALHHLSCGLPVVRPAAHASKDSR